MPELLEVFDTEDDRSVHSLCSRCHLLRMMKNHNSAHYDANAYENSGPFVFPDRLILPTQPYGI